MKKEEKKKLLTQFEQLCHEKGQKIKINDMSPIIEGFIDAVEVSLNDNNQSIYEELKMIAGHIKKLKEDITSIEPEHIAEHHIPGATLELDEVVKSLEEATNIILDTCEEIQNASNNSDNETIKNEIMEHTTKIFEACNFQDLTGQRIRKVMHTLEYIERAVKKILALPIAKVDSPKKTTVDPKDPLLNGPQRSGDAPSQDDIDKLFDSL